MERTNDVEIPKTKQQIDNAVKEAKNIDDLKKISTKTEETKKVFDLKRKDNIGEYIKNLQKEELVVTKGLSKVDKGNYNLSKKLPEKPEGYIRIYQTNNPDGLIKAGSYVDTSLNEHILRGTKKEPKVFQDIKESDFNKLFEAPKNVTDKRLEVGIVQPKVDIPANVYNDFAKPTRSIPIKQEIIKQPKIKTSKLARGVEQKSIEKGLIDAFEELPEYAEVNIKDQAKASSNLLKMDYKKALAIAEGKARPPEGILPESVFIAVEKQALKNKDVNILERLAKSNLTSEATGMGQRLRILAERSDYSPVSKMREVVNNRIKFIEEKTGKKVKLLEKDEIVKIKKEIKKVTPKKDEWVSFINSIEC